MIKNKGTRVARAKREDTTAVATLLAPLPGAIANDLRRQLAAMPMGFGAMRYDAETRCAYWLQADSEIAMSVTLPNLTEELAAEVWAAIAVASVHGDDEAILQIYDAVTGVEASPITGS